MTTPRSGITAVETSARRHEKAKAMATTTMRVMMRGEKERGAEGLQVGGGEEEHAADDISN